MDTARSNNRSSFAAEHGWGWPHVVGRLADLRWLRPDAATRARVAIRDLAGRGAASVRDWADAQTVETDRAYRNLIADAPVEDLPLWRLLVTTPGVLPTNLVGRLAPALAQLPADTDQDAVLVALVAGAMPPVEAMERLLGAAPRRLAEWKVRQHIDTNPTASAGERIAVALRSSTAERPRFRLQLIKRSLYLYPAPGPLVPSDLADVPPADLDLLLRWPHLLDLLAGTGARTASLGRTGGNLLTAAILQWRDAFRRRMWHLIIAAVRARDMDAACWGYFAQDQGMSQLPDNLEADFAAALRGPYQGLRGTLGAAVLARLVSAVPRSLSGLAQLVLTEPAHRLEAVGRLVSDVRGAAISAAHITELAVPFAVEVPEVDEADSSVSEAPAPSVDIGTVADFAAAVTDAGRAGEVLGALLDIGSADGPFAWALPVGEDVFRVWLSAEVVPPGKVLACFARVSGRIVPGRATLRNLAAFDAAGAGTAQLGELLVNATIRQQLALLDPEATSDLYLRLTRRLRDEGWLLPDAAAERAPSATEAAFRVMPLEVLIALIEVGALNDERLVSSVPTSLIRDITSSTDEAVVWSRLLDAASMSGRTLPSWLVARLAEDVRFIERALACTPVPIEASDLVLAALHSRRAAGLVDAWLTPEARGALLPWVRDQFAGSPTLAAAYEVAVAFALPYAPYLVALGRMIQVPAVADQRGRQFDHLYHTYALPKRSGGTRTITAPATGLKGLQRMLLERGFHALPLNDAATGFRPGRSIRDNAAAHVRQPVVVNIDIQSFFPSTGYDLILRACRSLAGGRLSERALRLVADICSYQGALPTGAPTSPAIANIVLTRVDRALSTAAARRGIRYTRYADDLTFSGGGHAIKLIPFAGRLLKELGYELDAKKTNIYRRGRRQVVTGLVVNEKANLPRRTRRRLRAALHHRELGTTPTWQGRDMDDPTLRGWLAFLAMLRPEDGRAALRRLEVARDGEVA